MKEEINKVQIAAEAWRPEQLLDWAFDTFGNSVAISSAFGAEGKRRFPGMINLRNDRSEAG